MASSSLSGACPSSSPYSAAHGQSLVSLLTLGYQKSSRGGHHYVSLTTAHIAPDSATGQRLLWPFKNELETEVLGFPYISSWLGYNETPVFRNFSESMVKVYDDDKCYCWLQNSRSLPTEPTGCNRQEQDSL